MRPMTRRDFLRTSGLAVLGTAVACNSNGGPAGPVSLNALKDGRTGNVQVLSAGAEIFANSPQRVVFGVRDPADGSFLQVPEGRLWAARDQTTTAIGPFPVVFRGEGLGDRGVYVSKASFPSDGTWIFFVEIGAGSEAKIGEGQLVVGQQTQMPKPGEAAISVASPTVDDPRGVDPICSRTPPCSMHTLSLDDALENGKPTALIIATPAYCSSALCGPEVDIVEAMSQEFAGRANFIHIEVLKDDDQETVAAWAERPNPDLFSPATAAWRVVAEPAIYMIDADGTILDRFVGPFDASEAREATAALVG